MNDTDSKVDYLNLVSHVETLLYQLGRKYFNDPRKEVRALNEFMMLGKTALDVLVLIEKLVLIRKEIRENPKFKSDLFWINATENISGALSYWQKIETMFESLFPEKLNLISKVSNNNQPIQDKIPSEKRNLLTFQEFCKTLPRSTQDEIKMVQVAVDESTGRVDFSGASDKAWQYIELYFRGSDVEIGRKL